MKTFNKSLSIILIIAVIAISKAGAQQNPAALLDAKQQSLIRIAAQTAKGDLPALKVSLNDGLISGLTINEIKEAIVHCYAYCGFPRSISALQAFIMVLDERKAKGINDVMGSEASPIEAKHNKYDRGKVILEKLTGVPASAPKKGYAAFAPIIEVFLKEHLFADVFERDVLSYTDRELLTISVIASIGHAEPMLASHLDICLHLGLTPAQLQQFLTIVATIIKKNKTKATEKVLNEVLNRKKNPNY